jgi:hypothetical protein
VHETHGTDMPIVLLLCLNVLQYITVQDSLSELTEKELISDYRCFRIFSQKRDQIPNLFALKLYTVRETCLVVVKLTQ